MDIPNPPEDEFDKDITGSADHENNFDDAEINAIEIFHGLLHTLHTMMAAGWTEAQAIRYLAFCSIYEGD